MTAKTLAYWATTGLVSLMMLGSAFGYLSGAMNDALAHLGYPAHFVMLLGAWKLGVAPALLSPGFAKLKELAYAGLFFTLTGASYSHLAVGDGVIEVVVPLVALAMTAVSWALHRDVRFGEQAPVVSMQPVPAK